MRRSSFGGRSCVVGSHPIGFASRFGGRLRRPCVLWQIQQAVTFSLAFHPAAGYLHRESGAVTNVAAEGDYWSSSPYSTEVNAGNLNFNSTGVYPVNATNRANGLSVRCVRVFARSAENRTFFSISIATECKTFSIQAEQDQSFAWSQTCGSVSCKFSNPPAA